MKKVHLIIGILTILTSILLSQDVKEADSKIDAFASKTGVIIKFIDYRLPSINLTVGIAETKVRKLLSGSEVGCFFRFQNRVNLIQKQLLLLMKIY